MLRTIVMVTETRMCLVEGKETAGMGNIIGVLQCNRCFKKGY